MTKLKHEKEPAGLSKIELSRRLKIFVFSKINQTMWRSCHSSRTSLMANNTCQLSDAIIFLCCCKTFLKRKHRGPFYLLKIAQVQHDVQGECKFSNSAALDPTTQLYTIYNHSLTCYMKIHTNNHKQSIIQMIKVVYQPKN